MSEMRPDAITPDAPTPGRVLAAARVACGMTVSEVATRLKYAPRQIAAIEEDRFDTLPGLTLGRGMIRNYARLVGIDPGPLLAAAEGQLKRGPSTVQPANLDVTFRSDPRRGSFVYVLLSLVVFAAVAAVLMEWSQADRVSTTSAAPHAADGTVGAPSAPNAPVVNGARQGAAESVPPAARGTIGPKKQLDLTFDADCWVQVRDANGEILLSQLNAAGTRRQVEGVTPFSVIIGNVAGVRLRYNDADVDLAPYARFDVARFILH